MCVSVSRAQCSVERSVTVHCRPGTVTKAEFDTVPDQRRTTSLRYVLRRIRDTKPARTD